MAFAASLCVMLVLLDRDWGGRSRPPQTKIFSHQCGGHLQPVGGLTLNPPPTLRQIERWTQQFRTSLHLTSESARIQFWTRGGLTELSVWERRPLCRALCHVLCTPYATVDGVWPSHIIIVPNFVKICPSIAEILHFFRIFMKVAVCLLKFGAYLDHPQRVLSLPHLYLLTALVIGSSVIPFVAKCIGKLH